MAANEIFNRCPTVEKELEIEEMVKAIVVNPKDDDNDFEMVGTVGRRLKSFFNPRPPRLFTGDVTGEKGEASPRSFRPSVTRPPVTN